MRVTGILVAAALVFATGWDLLTGAGELWHGLHGVRAPLGNLFLGGLVLTTILGAIDLVRAIKELLRLKPTVKTGVRAAIAGCLVIGLVAYIDIVARLAWIYWPALVAGLFGGLLPVATGTALKAMGAENLPLPGYIYMPPLDTTGMTPEQKSEAEDRVFIARMPVPRRNLLGL
jgi:hypothetical protein